MTAALKYLEAVRGILQHLEQTQLPHIDAAADLVVAALTHGGAVRCAGIGHSNEHDFLNRAGGLAAVQPFGFSFSVNEPGPECHRDRAPAAPVEKDLESIRLAVRTSALRKGDVVLIGSVSGRNRAPVETALACRAIGVKIVGLTALAYTAKVTSYHPSGQKLCDVSDVVIDNGAPYGDAAVAIPGMSEKMLPVSGVAMIIAGWMVWGRVMEKMAAAGDPPSTYISINRDDGKAYYDKNKAEYNRRGTEMSAQTYFETALEALRKVAESQRDRLAAAADLLVEAVTSDHSLFSFGASHSFMLTEELVYRTGGLMLINPIYPHGMNSFIRPMTLTSRLERVPGLGAELLAGSPARAGDVLILTSTSGRNAVTIDMALAARDRGVQVIGITSLAYTTGVSSRHPSGKKMVELCDVVIDNGAPYGDAAVAIPGLPQKVGPLSSLTGIAIVNALVAEVVDRLVKKGVQPPIFMSANVDGGDAWNARLLTANRHRIHYLD